MSNMTELKMLKYYRPYEETAVVRTDDGYPKFVMVNDYNGCNLIAGPVVDRLYEFERLGMEPEEITKLIRKRTHDEVKTELANMADKLRAENADLKKKIEELDYEIDAMDEEYSKLYDEATEWECKCEDLEIDLNNALERENVHNQLIDEQRKKIEELSKDNEYLHDEYKKLIGELDKAHIQLRNQRDHIKDLNNIVDKYEVMRQTLQALCGVEIDI